MAFDVALALVIPPSKPIEFYADEVGKELTFNVTLDGEPVDLTYDQVFLVVAGNAGSPFELEETDTEGVLKYVVQAGDFPAGTDPITRYSCFLRLTDTPYDDIVLSNEFPIYVLAAPTPSL